MKKKSSAPNPFGSWFTEPNVSVALGNNTLIVALPNADRTGSITQFGSTAQQRYTVVIPDGLYDVEGLQRAVNIAVNHIGDARSRGGGTSLGGVGGASPECSSRG